MKKTLIILAAVLLIAGLFIACSADINSADETASVSFGNGAKGLSYTTTPAGLPDVNSLIWWYKATKSGDSGAAGTTPGWTRINPSGTGLATTLTGFKIGSGWTFTIAGKDDAETDTEPASGYTDCVYYGTNDAVTLRRGNNTININLNWVSPTTASVSFSDIVVYESEDEFPQDTNYDTWQIWENEAISGATGTLSSYESTISYNLESIQANEEHTYIVKVFDYQGSLIASQTVTIYAYPGSTITVTGSIDNLNVSADVDINTNYNDLAIWKSGASAPEMMSLSEFAQKVNNGEEGYSTATVVLNRDVDLTNVTWTPIGTEENPFCGTFYGKYNTISNLNMTSSGTSAGYGFFGYVGGNCIIKDLTLSNCDLTYSAGKEAGLLVGVASNKNDDGSDSLTIINVVSDSNCSVVVGDKGGGFVGRLYCNGTFENVVNNANVSGNQRVSGLVAQCHAAKDVTFINCHNFGCISLNKVDNDYIKTGDSFGVAAGFVAHHNGANITYSESCTSNGPINAPLAVSFIAYVNSTTLYKGNNTWDCDGGSGNSLVQTMKMKGVIENVSSTNYFVAMENAYHLEHGFDGIFYNSGNSYDVLFYGPNDFEGGVHAEIPIRMTITEWNDGTYVTSSKIGIDGTHNPHKIELLSDITWTRVYSFGTSIHVIVDLKGHTLTPNVIITEDVTGIIQGAPSGGATRVTLKNGTIDDRESHVIGKYIAEENVTEINVEHVR